MDYKSLGKQRAWSGSHKLRTQHRSTLVDSGIGGACASTPVQCSTCICIRVYTGINTVDDLWRVWACWGKARRLLMSIYAFRDGIGVGKLWSRQTGYGKKFSNEMERIPTSIIVPERWSYQRAVATQWLEQKWGKQPKQFLAEQTVKSKNKPRYDKDMLKCLKHNFLWMRSINTLIGFYT